MLALLLATQIAAATLPQGVPLEVVPPPRGSIMPIAGLLRDRPAKACPGAGRMETAFARPTALYRSGDRPPKALKHWADYPAAHSCLVAEDAP